MSLASGVGMKANQNRASRHWIQKFRNGTRRIARLLWGKYPKPEAHLTGEAGEVLAYWFLREHGYTIEARNYRRPPWREEIDLIAWEGGELVFIEVKTRTTASPWPAEQAVDSDKRRHLLRLGSAYARQRRAERYRFDVLAIHAPRGEAPRMELHRDAFRHARDPLNGRRSE